jgi:PAS domain S-box-containing protein
MTDPLSSTPPRASARKRSVMLQALFILRALFCFVLIMSPWMVRPAIAASSHSVLFLLETESNLPASVAIVAALREAMNSAVASGLVLNEEYLDLDRFRPDDQKALMADYLRRKYAEAPIDLIIAGGARALDFLLDHRTDLFPSAQIMYTAIGTTEVLAHAIPPDVVGIKMRFDAAATLKFALHIQPDTRQVVVVSGASPYDRTLQTLTRQELADYKDRLNVTYLSALPVAEILHEVAALPAKTIVLYLTVFQDGAGKQFFPRDVAAAITKASSVPVYGIYDTYLPAGIVGGHMDTFEEIGTATGNLALRLLAGELPAIREGELPDIGADHASWPALQRWNIAEQRLPPGTIEHFKQPTLWSEYRWQIITVVALVGVQTLLLLALLIQARRRRRAESSVKESETRMALATESANLGLWYWERPGDLWSTPIFREIMGLKAVGQAGFEHFLAQVHRDDREVVRGAFARALDREGTMQIDYRVMSNDGATKWISASGRTIFGSGRATRLMGVIADITERRQSEAELAAQRAQLTHLTRIAVLGEMSGALAHELSQPLTAILANAQAAQKLLERQIVDVAEFRGIVADIVAEDVRAGEVIQHLRSLFKKEAVNHGPVAVNELLSNVLNLAKSELVIRNITLTTDLAPDLALINGDHVQLQQVFLNLIINACEAMQDNEAEDRALVIATSSGDAGNSQISFVDNGPGIHPELVDRLFQPFVTSKPHGLGLGLSVCRTIVQSHGGRLWASNNSRRGATFWIALPTLAQAAQ